jgi:hypothetical protein
VARVSLVWMMEVRSRKNIRWGDGAFVSAHEVVVVC